ncbi:MAG TPA: SagB family peptide dehydrogenase [Terriglobia bacterium]|jgi:SagB-type dehydrogenase family enzyme
MLSDSSNRDTSRAWAYHNATKHSEWSLRSSPHYLDWANQPKTLKIYTTVEPIPLPRDADLTGISALSAISSTAPPAGGNPIPSLADLGRLFYFSAGITKKKTYSGGETYFRAASCTGALYEIELYLVCGDLPGLNAGVYHFGPGDFALRLLRSGDYRGVVGIQAPAVVVCTGTYWRNAWKYRARTYRHFGWDNGTIIANLLAMTAALQLPAEVHCEFIDGDVNRLLDIDINKEVAFSLVSIGHTDEPLPAASGEMPKLNLPTVALSEKEVDYPEMRAMHEASSIQEVRVSDPLPAAKRPAGGRSQSMLKSLSVSSDTIEQVILRRGSSRKFERKSMTREQLQTILVASTQGIPADFPALNDLYLIVNAVEGLESGSYFYQPGSHTLECLKAGNFRSNARYLGLGQELPGDAAVDVFFMADLHSVLDRFGNRGYRAVQLESGILGGKMYLAAYAQRLGATGLTFFDDDVTAFFSPHASGKSAIFLVAIGIGARPTRW